jgi:hypothetical protein
VPQAISLGCYAQLYRQVLAALGARVRFRLAADVTLATFFISHLTPFGSATGTLVNASTLETEGIARGAAGWLTAFRVLISAEQGVFSRVAEHLSDRGWAAYLTLKPIAR